MKQQLPMGKYLYLCLFYQLLDYTYHLKTTTKQKSFGKLQNGKDFLGQEKKLEG